MRSEACAWRRADIGAHSLKAENATQHPVVLRLLTMGSLTFRPVDSDHDAAQVLVFARDLFVTSFGSEAKFDREFGPDGADYLSWLRERVAEYSGSAVIVLEGREPIGMVVTGPYSGDPTIGYVHHYHLAPSARGRRLGRCLDEYAVSTLADRGYRRARLSVVLTNVPATRFYEKLGWKDAGPRPGQEGVVYLERVLYRNEHRRAGAARVGPRR